MLDVAPVLVFPAGMADACRFAAQAAARGETVIGASSLAFDPARAQYGDWAHLPFYNAPDFADRLAALVRERGIARIHTPHPIVHAFLRALLPELELECRLDGSLPYASDLATYRTALRDASALAQAGDGIGSGAPAPVLGVEAAAAFLRQVRAVPGMCDDTKLWALAAIARHAPRGDLVEIGSWWGKSAAALSWLAARYAIGNLLCVDPWSPAEAVQDNEDVDALTATADHEEAARLFRVSLLSLGCGNVNYLRLPSVQGAERFKANPVIHSDAFGTTRYSHAIAVLHVDGNHQFDQVQADLAAWLPLLCDGGWLILDDYAWPFGDGPQRVGDGLLLQRAEDVACAFTAGSALFVRLRRAGGVQEGG